MRPADLSAYLGRLTAGNRRVVRALRGVIRAAAPKCEESILWDGVSYHRPWLGGRVKGAVCQIVVRRGVVRLDFIHGVRLRDPSRLLRGDGLAKRHVPIGTSGDAGRPEIAALVRDAAAFDPSDPGERRRRTGRGASGGGSLRGTT